MKKIILIFACLAVSLFTHSISKAQTNNWMRIQSDNGEFSIEIPVDYTYFFDSDGFTYDDSGGKTYQFAQMQMLNSTAEKTVMSVEIYQVSSPKNYLSQLLDKQKMDADKKDESQPGFTIKKFEQRKIKDINGKEIEISHITKFIASKTHLYILTVANRGAKTSTFEHFLESVRLNASLSNPPDNAQTIKISSLKPITIAQIAESTVNSQKPDNPPKTPDLSLAPVIKPTPILILTKPRPGYTEAARTYMTTGKIRLRVTFEKDGRISKIGLLEVLDNGLNRSAFFAAMRIKFIPQEKDGVPETVIKQIEYSFSIY